MTSIDLIDLVDCKGKNRKEFYGLQKLERKIEDPTTTIIIKYYSYNFDITQKKEKNLKKHILLAVRNYNNFDVIKKNIMGATIIPYYSHAAEIIFNELKEKILGSSENVNKNLVRIYLGLGYKNSFVA